MNISVKLLESNSVIRNLILSALRDDINACISKSMSSITDQVKDVVRKALKDEPEYSSLISGQLKAEFGISDSSSVDAVINKLVDTLVMTRNPVSYNNAGLTGGFTLTMIKSDDLGGVVGDESAKVVDSERGYELPWLEWLALFGNRAIVKNYEVKMGAHSHSRSGLAIMVESKKNWRVPAQFVGTITSNWITRAIERVDPQIYKIIQNAIEANI